MIFAGLIIAFLVKSSVCSSVDPAGSFSRLNQLNDKTYGVIIDCGSSGTRANIFQWNTTSNGTELLHGIDYLRDANGPVSFKKEPGLSEMSKNPEKSSDYMGEIIDFIFKVVPPSALPSTGLYLMATAGMRLLDVEDQNEILNDIKDGYKDDFSKFAKTETNTITGAQEGMYQWIALNSKLKSLVDTHGPAKNTSGLIEMGGASIQVTYEIKEYTERMTLQYFDSMKSKNAFRNSIISPEISKSVKQLNYRLVSVTFLGFGSNSARDIYVDFLILKHKERRFQYEQERFISGEARSDGRSFENENKGLLKLKDPCLPKGAIQMMEKPERILRTLNKNLGINVDDDEPTIKVMLIGEGNYGMCWWNLFSVLQLAKSEGLNCRKGYPCEMELLGTRFVPHESFKFFGLGSFYYSTNSLNLEGIYNRAKVKRKTRDVCNTPYDKLKKLNPTKKEHMNRILLQCFTAVWIDIFLTAGLKMPDDNKMFETIGKLKGDNMNWTLGAVIEKSLAITKAITKQTSFGRRSG